VPHKSYTFGGKVGTVVCTVAFKKVGIAEQHIPASSDTGMQDQLYLCVDVRTDLLLSELTRMG
jgi:hypothetical protein